MSVVKHKGHIAHYLIFIPVSTEEFIQKFVYRMLHYTYARGSCSLFCFRFILS